MTTLNAIQLRVLGALLEKSLAQPEYYPMTLNALVAACNQKSNRDPTMSLDEDAVWNALEALRGLSLVTRLLPGGASRVERFKHDVKQTLGWEKVQWPVLSELILRGPQTAGELRTRCARLYPYENSEALSSVIENLMRTDPPIVALLERAAGQSASRYMHLLGVERPGNAALAGAPRVEHQRAAPAASGAAMPDPIERGELAALRQEIAALRHEFSELKQAVAPLLRNLG